MFDVGFTEIMVIAVVALIVIGPERLPKVARTLGHLFGRAQRYVNDVKTDIQREMELDELKKLQTSVRDTVHSIENTVRQEVQETQDQLQAVTDVETPTIASSTPSAPTVSSELSEPSPETTSSPSPQLELGLGDDAARKQA